MRQNWIINEIFIFFRWLTGLNLLGGVIFCIFAKVHLFCVRRSAANIDYNKCNDASVPKTQQRYNPNILRGIKVEMALASIIVDFCFKFIHAQSQPFVGDQMMLIAQFVTQISGLFWYVLLPFLYILFTQSVRNHITVTYNIKNKSIAPKANWQKMCSFLHGLNLLMHVV